ncbi:MAG: hypothetical protein KDA31_06145 [Phycisphaerales bacterium]|nr:hypothetical protein [Phycisphaerales bacterium]
MLLILVLVGQTRAQSYTQSSGYTVRTWSTEHGLPQASVNTICQTPDGYLWLGTNGGLVRFDGFEFETFDFTNSDMPSIRVTSLIRDNSNGMWAGTEEGWIVHLGETFTTLCRLPVTPYELLSLADGKLLALTRAGLFEINGSHYNLVRASANEITGLRPIRGLAEDAAGRVWYSLDDIRQLDPVSENRETAQIASRGFVLRANRVGDVAVLTLDRLNLIVSDAESSRVIDLGACDASTLLLTNEELWLFGPTECKAADLASLRAGTPDWHNLGLPTQEYTRAYIDRESTVWVGTLTAGFVAIRPSGFHAWPLRDNQAGQSVTGTDDLIIAGGNQNMNWVMRLVGSDFEPVGVVPGATSDLLYTRDRGSIVVSTNSGLVELDPQQEVFVPLRRWDIGTPVFSYAESSDRRVAVGTKSTVMLRDPGDTQFRRIASIPEIATGIVRCIDFVDDGILFGAHSGLFHVELPSESFREVRCDDDQPVTNVRSIHTDADGTLWIGTYGSGLLRYKGGVLSRLTTADGLIDNCISNLQEDQAARLWMNTNAGAVAVDIEALNHAIDDHVQVVGVAHLYSGECNHHGGWISSTGMLWFPTIFGLSSIDTASVGFNDVPPGVAIKSIAIEGEPILISANNRIGPGVDDLRIAYVGLSYITPSQVRYRRKLVGLDDDWIDVGGERTVSYTNLKPGEYEFCVQACNNSGVWSPVGASIAFEILPHYYETKWFLLLVVLMLLVLAWVLYRFRVAGLASHNRALVSEISRREIAEAGKQEVEEQLRRTQKLEAIGSLASGVTHDFNNVLFAIETSAISLSSGRGKPGDVEQATDVIRQSIAQARGIISSLKTFSQRNEVEHKQIDLCESVRMFETTLRTLVEPDYELVIEGLADDPFWVIGNASQLQQVVLNLVVNARDASAIGAPIGIRVGPSTSDSAYVELRVTDAGPGISAEMADRIFDPFFTTKTHEQGTGLGLSIVHGIVRDHAGRIRVESSTRGTEFVVEFPLCSAPKGRD